MWEWLEWLSCISHWVCQIVHASTSSKHCSTSLNIYNPSWYNQMYIWKARHLWGMEDFTVKHKNVFFTWMSLSCVFFYNFNMERRVQPSNQSNTQRWVNKHLRGSSSISGGGGSAAHLTLTHSCFKDNMSPVWLAWRMGEVGKLAHCRCVWVLYLHFLPQ